MSAIMSALRKSEITRLKLTHNQLSDDTRSIVKKLGALLNPHNNYSAYVATLNGSNNLGCIPFLGKLVTARVKITINSEYKALT